MSTEPKRIRVGMVRCDGHAYTYGPLMDKCNPLIFRENFHTEYFWMIDGNKPQRLRTPIVPGFELVKVWDADPQKAHNVAHTFFDKPRVCYTLGEMLEDIDAVFINDCNGDGSDHLELSTPFLKKGIPTYVDKPFASTLKDAKAMVDLAIKHNTPLMSASILGYVNEVTFLKRRFIELHGPIRLGVVKGVGGTDEQLGAIIHGIALAQGVFGIGVEWVECMGEYPLEYMLLHYPYREQKPLLKVQRVRADLAKKKAWKTKEGIEVIIMNTPGVFDGFYCDVYSQQGHNPPFPGHVRSYRIYDHEFIGGALNILSLFKKMVRSRKPPIPYEYMLELIAIVEAGREAQKKRRRVYLKDVMRRVKE